MIEKIILAAAVAIAVGAAAAAIPKRKYITI